MAKKKPKALVRGAAAAVVESSATSFPSAAALASGSEAHTKSPTSLNLPSEAVKGDWTAILLALMMFFAPAVAVPHEMMLQDTLKSIVVACITFFAAALFFYQQRQRLDGLRWHLSVGLFGLLALYALGSMLWAHTYLAGVEAARWIVLTLVLFLALNTFSRERIPLLAAAVHFGAVAATCLAAAQFWFDWRGIPQGPPPASSFVNRNFYAEFVACTVPFGAYLLFSVRRSPLIFLLAFTNGFTLVGIMMTGTRSAMIATGLSLVFIAIATLLYRKKLGLSSWTPGQKMMAGLVLASTLGFLGSISTPHKFYPPSSNAWERAFSRAASVVNPEEYTTGSASIRKVMWEATARVIERRPLSGVGAGSWEADIPLYQRPGDSLETDYYVHNELLQLLSEYGLVGWVFLLALLSYLAISAWRTVSARTDVEKDEAPVRAFILMTLLAFLTVSNAGFPWRMASTGAMFALALGALAASDARLGYRSVFGVARLRWKPDWARAALMTSLLGLGTSIYVSYKAWECERLIVTATKSALMISASGDPNSPRWDRAKKQLFDDLRRGIEINPHYRKITPMVADEAARWGDWKNATWIWESVLTSRPYVTGIIANAARGNIQMGNLDKALEWVERGRRVQPYLAHLWGAEVTALQLKGENAKAVSVIKEALKRNIADLDLLSNGFPAAVTRGEWALATEMLERRAKAAPQTTFDSYLRLGNLYRTYVLDERRSAAYLAKAVSALPQPSERVNFLATLPQSMLPKMGLDLPKLGIPESVWNQLLAPRANAPAPFPTQPLALEEATKVTRPSAGPG